MYQSYDGGRGGRGGRGGGGGYRPDLGFCSVHRRRRAKTDLIEIPDQPGQFRCPPHNECRMTGAFTQARAEMVMCCLHGRRRNKASMKEVGPDVWECVESSRCRTGPMVPHHQQSFARPGAIPTPSAAVPADMRQQNMAEVGSAWAPEQMNISASMKQVLGGPGSSLSLSSYALTNTVWCAKHGKRIQRQAARSKDDSYFVCLDEATCLADGLKLPDLLVREGCKELLCSKHGSLRYSNYMKLQSAGYACDLAHPCRYDGLSSLAAEGEQEEDTNEENAPAVPSGAAASTAGAGVRVKQEAAPVGSAFFS